MDSVKSRWEEGERKDGHGVKVQFSLYSDKYVEVTQSEKKEGKKKKWR